MIHVRPARDSDLETHARLWYERAVLAPLPRGLALLPDASAHWKAQAQRWLVDADCTVLTAEETGEVVGFAAVRREPGPPGCSPERIGRILGFALDAHTYHAGAGRALVEGLRHALRGQGVGVLVIDTPAHSPVEQAFWRALRAEPWSEALWLNL